MLGMAAFSSTIEHADGCTGIARAFATNGVKDGENEHNGTEDLYIAVIGWTDLGAHQRAMETKAFTENVPLIEDSAKDITMYHVKLEIV